MEKYDLSRYVQMHQRDFEIALSEIKSGRKTSHWMWYIFPQIYGLGKTSTSIYYAIKCVDEAKAFLDNEYLCGNINRICKALLELKSDNATEIFGTPDDMKLRSSMTLFACVSQENSVFELVLKKYFDGKPDDKTIKILGL